MSDAFNEAYYNSVNEDLLALLPTGAQAVLEIGCGAAALAARYRQRNPGCHYTGVEFNPVAAGRAAAVLDRLIEGDVEALVPETLAAPGSLDLIVYGDVLEHLREPWAVVRAHRALLRPNGVMAACLPNVQHWLVVRDLLLGHWTYADAGVMDRTHLRFFTPEGAAALFTGAGLAVEQIVGRRRVTPEFDAFREAIVPALERLGCPDALTSMSVIQTIILARNGEA